MVEKHEEHTYTHPFCNFQLWLEVKATNGSDRNRVYVIENMALHYPTPHSGSFVLGFPPMVAIETTTINSIFSRFLKT
jgi:hypothetical protein